MEGLISIEKMLSPFELKRKTGACTGDPIAVQPLEQTLEGR